MALTDRRGSGTVISVCAGRKQPRLGDMSESAQNRSLKCTSGALPALSCPFGYVSVCVFVVMLSCRPPELSTQGTGS